MLDLERCTVFLPAIGLFTLKAADDFLLEQAEFVVDAVAVTGHTKSRERFEEARSQPAQAAVAESRVGFTVENFVETDAETGEHTATQFFDAQVGDVISQRATHEEFHGEVIE